MLSYPGGTPHDHATTHYSLSQNFLSDLGMTVAYDGERNGLGAALFTLSLLLLVVGLGGCLIAFVRTYAPSSTARRWACASGAVGVLACLAFTGVALTPENLMMDLHVAFTRSAWWLVAAAALPMCAASVASRASRRTTRAWAILAVALVAYAALNTWGPSAATASGLTVQVVAQKSIALTVMLFLVYLTSSDGLARGA